jgi:hypothetical protein
MFAIADRGKGMDAATAMRALDRFSRRSQPAKVPGSGFRRSMASSNSLVDI